MNQRIRNWILKKNAATEEDYMQWKKDSGKEYQRKRHRDNVINGLCSCGKQRIEGKKYCDGCRDSQMRYYWRLRAELLEAYGNKCNCPGCGVDIPEFLALDHVNNDGKAHRTKLKAITTGIYRDLRKRGFPKEGYQLLCHNCNMAKQLYGECPHLNRLKVKG